MSVEGVGGKAAAISFPIAPASPVQQTEAQTPAVKPARRRSVHHSKSAPIAPPFVVTPAVLAINAGIAVLLHTGRLAAFAPGSRRGSQANAEVVEREESADELPHDHPDRLSALRTELSRLPPSEIERLRELADKARERGFGFVIQPLELPAPPGSHSEEHLRLNPFQVDEVLADRGRLYVGELTNIPKPPPSQGVYQVVDAKGAEPIVSSEALRSFLNLFR